MSSLHDAMEGGGPLWFEGWVRVFVSAGNCTLCVEGCASSISYQILRDPRRDEG